MKRDRKMLTHDAFVEMYYDNEFNESLSPRERNLLKNYQNEIICVIESQPALFSDNMLESYCIYGKSENLYSYRFYWLIREVIAVVKKAWDEKPEEFDEAIEKFRNGDIVEDVFFENYSHEKTDELFDDIFRHISSELPGSQREALYDNVVFAKKSDRFYSITFRHEREMLYRMLREKSADDEDFKCFLLKMIGMIFDANFDATLDRIEIEKTMREIEILYQKRRKA